MMPWIALATVLLAVALAGCADLPYYWQAAGGQFELWQRSRPIEELVADQTTEADIKARLERVQAIRTFASRELGLPDNASYRTYADLGRPFVAWNLFAAPELSLTPKEWCFPVAGCVTYRGYFAEAGARVLAGELQAQGLDTYVGGVPAYSTLGWFADPVPSTIIAYPDLDLARLIFHELAHQLVYVPGDTLFNESFATTVEREGVRRWAEAKGTPADLNRLAQAEARTADFTGLVLGAKARLEQVYAGPGDPQAKRAAKTRIIDGLRSDYARIKAGWGAAGRLDAWFAGPLNNAQIASVAVYTQRVPAFSALLRQLGGDLLRFYAEVKALARLPKVERHSRLAGLGPSDL
jgi:predicted aminopeptidase